MTYDTIIIGGGPGGYTAAVYAARYKMNTLVIAKELGGLMAKASEVGNWPGIQKIKGAELMHQMEDHVRSLNVEIVQDEVTNLKKENDGFVVTVRDGKTYETKTIILSLGLSRRKLNIPGENEFAGKGVSYCAVCDAGFYKDKTVAVVGGSDSAAQSALLLAEYATKVYMIYRKDKLRAEPMLVDSIEKNEKIEVIYNANVVEASGSKFLEKIKLDTNQELQVDGLFIAIGYVPTASLVSELGVELDDNSYIKINKKSQTNVDGVYAAGDATNSVFRQAITAAAEGGVAALSAYNFIKSK